VKAICARYGQHYNTGSLPKQFGQVVWRILRHAFPSRPAPERPLVAAEPAEPPGNAPSVGAA
jgi:linoleoyl-CoA desaturase